MKPGKPLTLAITAGTLNGIGPEIILKTLAALQPHGKSVTYLFPQIVSHLKKVIDSFSDLELIVIGSMPVFHWYARRSNLPLTFNKVHQFPFGENFSLGQIYRIIVGKGKQPLLTDERCKIFFVDIPLSLPPKFKNMNDFMRQVLSFKKGEKTSKQLQDSRLAFRSACKLAGENAYKILEVSAALIRSGKVSGVVNAPVSKELIAKHSPLKNFIGQTEFYADIFGTKKFSMTFFSPLFNLLLLTTHVPISQVATQITSKSVNRVIDHAWEIRKCLKEKRKILFLGVNPHAGENGKIGKDDLYLESLIKKHRHASAVIGPVSADTAFIKVFAGDYRVVIACYHDQGLIPIKSINDNILRSVNVTWGLPFIRMTVDHGTAPDIAGKDLAQPYSFMSSLTLALQMMKKTSRQSSLSCGLPTSLGNP